MDSNHPLNRKYDLQIEKLLNDFISIIYKGQDHIIARKYYRELFQSLIPKYFCICDNDKVQNGSDSGETK